MNLSMPSAPASSRGVSHPGAAFAGLGLSPSIVRALGEEGYVRPTPVQLEAIPPLLDGRDLLACAQTGTGKTAAFLLPLLERLAADRLPKWIGVRALVLAPTRELAAQIAERAGAYGKHLGIRHAVIYGGVAQGRQETALRGCELLIATPGRLLDLMQQRILSLAEVEMLVLDEADRMLDMGFINDVRRVLAKLPSLEQTALFSATIPPTIRRLANDILRDPAYVAVEPEVRPAPSVTHGLCHVAQADKRTLLLKVLSEDTDGRRAIVFTRTKHGANRVCAQLVEAGVSAGVIHGNKTQNARERVLDAFRAGTTRVLVATDIAARGIDVDDVGLVVNFDLPHVAESYVHRIGRAGRAGAVGAAVAFCDPTEGPLLAEIEKLVGFRLPVLSGTPRPAAHAQSSHGTKAPTANKPLKTNPARRRSRRRGGNPQR